MRVLSLFSGGGLGDYGLTLAGMEIVAQVEIDEYCQKILKLRWPEVPKWRDIRDVSGEEVIERCGRIDIVSGGFPCQPYSTAGRRTGKEDSRYLWPEMLRVIREVRPRWVLAENVPGLLSISDGRVFGTVVRDLAESGYCVEWDCIPASALGAHHQRDRVWILAHAGYNGRGAEPWQQQKERAKVIDSSSERNVADSEGTELPSIWGTSRTRRSEFGRSSWWAVEPDVGRVAHGVANRVDRLKCLGNGQVPQVVRWIGERILEADAKIKNGR